ncbi:MAG: metal ABC transporter ATP-binding protein [Ideonella sp. WA131b]|jgi:zinc/manganese transport system ATP-binding protein|nr:metal ABC transporter ATP-binding protein [Ideonella sp. WA131b]
MNAAVTVRDLTVSYRGHPAVHHLSGAFAAGALTAVVGPNGAGKSTLLGALGGTIRDFEGRIERDSSLRVAYLPQASSLDRSFPVRVHEAVTMGLWSRIGSFGGLRPEDRSGIDEALAAVGLIGFAQRWLGELSAGQAQRVLFARVLVQDAGLILLDEPFNAIDARTTADLLALLHRWKQEARTVIAVLHDIEQVREHFEQVLLLARERVVWGPTAEVLKAEHLFKARQMAEAWDESAPACKVSA